MQQQLSSIPRFYQEILKKEFVVDQQAEPIWKAPRATMDRASSPSDTAVQQDLYTQMCDVLQAKDRLENLADELKNQTNKGTTETFGRMFRSALPLLDTFDRVITLAQQHPPSEELQNWLRSVAGVQARMVDLFTRFGLQIIDPTGERVNLDRHEVVEVLHTDSIPDETIVEVRQKGYNFEGKVLRDARVVVAQNTRR
ncbi:TPA: nucleotide exchange factor GrpE [Candidatus Sumerlaeota bacterium]|jgi:molecular chaperone GrpE|nr:nucleotide exchange factor GrpE [Candidatus Sumerlaeota bacterium]